MGAYLWPKTTYPTSLETSRSSMDHSPASSSDFWSLGQGGSVMELGLSGQPTLTASAPTLRRSEADPDEGIRNPKRAPNVTELTRTLPAKPSDSDVRRRLIRDYVNPQCSTTWADLEPALLAAPVASDRFPIARTALFVAIAIVVACLPLSCGDGRVAEDRRVAKVEAVGAGW